MSIQNARRVPSMGDPTIIGWITVIVYFVVAIICLKAATSTDSNKTEKRFWLYLTIFSYSYGH